MSRFDSIRTLLSVAANEGLRLAQFNVIKAEKAFLDREFHEIIYMNQVLKMEPVCMEVEYKSLMVLSNRQYAMEQEVQGLLG